MQRTLRWAGSILLVLLLALPTMSENGNSTHGGRDRHPVAVFTGDTVSAHFADGENWTTEFVFINLSNVPHTAELYFYNSEGFFQPVHVKGMAPNHVFSFTLQPYGSFRLETLGESRTVTQGFAVLEPEAPLVDQIGASAIFRRELPGIPTYEAAVPFGSLFDEKAYLPFDHRNGFLSAIAVVNLSPYEERVLPLKFYDENGSLITSATLTLAPYNHTAFSLAAEVPELIGRVGMVVVSIQEPDEGISGFHILGLRFNPDGPFTTITPMLSATESLGL